MAAGSLFGGFEKPAKDTFGGRGREKGGI